MKQDGHYAGEDQGSYVLPVTNVDEQRRNFVGYRGNEQYYTLEDIRQGDPSGTTDTDYETHGSMKSGSYTNIYMKHGKPLAGKSGSKPGPMKSGRY